MFDVFRAQEYTPENEYGTSKWVLLCVFVPKEA